VLAVKEDIESRPTAQVASRLRQYDNVIKREPSGSELNGANGFSLMNESSP
jgi:hypothetical protein